VTWNANSPNQGNYLNLRNLGTTRSLILLDGVRVPPTSFAGGVDINTLPQALVQRVDVVTGGASAAYGSDALVGVVNFILDKNFKGVKGSIQGGTSKYGDANSYKATLAAGMSFAGGRGHIEGSVEHFESDPIKPRTTAPTAASSFSTPAAPPFRRKPTSAPASPPSRTSASRP
jgi:iron complex outermembrane receptor protein